MRRLLALLFAAGFVLVVAGCGGIDKGKLESAIKKQTGQQLKARGSSVTVSSVNCSKQQDSYHFSCLVKGSDGSSLRVAASCDHDGNCKWRRA